MILHIMILLISQLKKLDILKMNLKSKIKIFSCLKLKDFNQFFFFKDWLNPTNWKLNGLLKNKLKQEMRR